MEFAHTSVLLDECIEGLAIKPDGVYVDGTLGGAGHSIEIAKRLGEKGILIGIDRDKDAIEAATRRLEPFKEHIRIVRSNYGQIGEVLNKEKINAVDGILLDLGVSSFQLDNEERGFSYRFDGKLDMRMDDRDLLTAEEIVNTYTEEELTRIIRDYGEERFAGKIASNICSYRRKTPIKTAFELNEIIASSIPARMRATGGHPSKRTFQAIRIECNRELEVLKDSLDTMISLLNPKGRLCIITFHSLEDRIVKTAFRNAENPCTCPPSFPVCVCGKKPLGHAVNRKPILPSEEEIGENKRAKSAKLRIFEKA
ncbi:MAG: 16S rRNA (cytosine(1402)-N(4))-methyltransferase RsmH [Lachnospiraceae bacterium]|nr:16S rRNA (cytosine(1402)-N(4))-methyltransferase RsmH [Lachnospiraceae bacterium]